MMETREPEFALPWSLELWQQTLDWQPSSKQQAQFQHLYELILRGNRHLNLTRITDPQDFWEKHLWDSLRGTKPWLQAPKQLGSPGEWGTEYAVSPMPASPSLQVIDIGTGAGFPGLPLAIARPNWAITLLDSTRKKMAFVDTAIADLDITNARTFSERVEHLGHSPVDRAAYDLAVIRAVAAASVCAEYALPLLKVGGIAVLYRGQWSAEESMALDSALQELGGTIEQVEDFTTPLTHGQRHCIYLKKTEPTPSIYPRPVGIPTRSPL